MKLEDIPLVLPLAEWVWGADPTDSVSPTVCLDLVPYGLGTFFSGGCFSVLFAKALGVSIILGACLNKAPVMVNMWNSQSGAGFSRLSMYMETVVYANGAAYGMLELHPFTAYGENMALWLQNLILIGMIWKFTDNPLVPLQEKIMAAAGCFVYYGFVISIPVDLRYLLQASNGVILMVSRGAQVFETYKAQHTGAQSIVTNSLNLAGGLARIFTTMKETGDMAVLFGFAVSVALNSAMFVQYFLYQANTEKFLADLQAQKKAKTE
ncbi:Mannose-P-dolichol utilization defect 1 protein homolog [Seminavis robusta]|uniref:Mannose-P-dolichol utilization defect 1 protein homolog n=1 Tax=Seminavis robusta TaxID=568900 RepID=A0A9N8DL49_9STRA|nr:Mannose-P-dolichol utilization defect 1 protein homolog [Seminavis robusta]|eukprot:Sro217_g089920.1 Mannose-P-dolichol utilization defect 1 protein homolog (266) ;mRNA; f:84492-85289